MTLCIEPALEIPAMPGTPTVPTPSIPPAPPTPELPRTPPNMPGEPRDVPDVPAPGPTGPPIPPPDLPPEPTGPRRDPDPLPAPEPPVLPPATAAPGEAPSLPPDPGDPRRPAALLSRRAFLHGGLLTLAGGVFAACGARVERTGLETGSTTLRLAAPVLPSPQPPGAADAAVTPAPDGPLTLDGFLALSALLTGFAGLSPSLGAIYFESLRASPKHGAALADLYRQGGFAGDAAPATVEELDARGALANEGARAAADRLIDMWYSGVYDTPDGGQAVATFADALVWRAVQYTKPLTICGAPGYWSEAPEVVFD